MNTSTAIGAKVKSLRIGKEKMCIRDSSWTVGELREWLLDIHTTNEMIRKISRGLTSEMIAAVCKLMGNLDLVYASAKIQVTAHCNTTIGLPGTFSSRLQPNHTTDNLAGIMASVMEGLSYGCGAVSYTHLDVYKRQHRRNWWRITAISWKRRSSLL